MWKFKELYEAVQKKFESGNILPKIKDTIEGNWYAIHHLNDPVHDNPEHPHLRRRYEQGGSWYPGKDRDISMADEYGNIDIPHMSNPCAEITIPSDIHAEDIIVRKIDVHEPASNYGEPGIHPRYAICKKHGENYLYYDTNRFKECPKCREEQEVIPDFLSESDMLL